MKNIIIKIIHMYCMLLISYIQVMYIYKHVWLYSSSFMKLGMSLTGRLLACAFTRRFLSSVSRTTLSLSPVRMCVCVCGERRQ